ncbi:MAG: TIGR04053 family radical SAM/SPASM domain-containing protein [Firmicutes bacterium]|nr:TIGR04053 family radical SAM/SPASM domain-containing protein [Bacillota bacterium]
MPSYDFSRNPFIVIWETTRTCQLACRHCRAKAIKHRNPNELSTYEAKQLIDQLVEMEKPLFVLTGGDPMERADLIELVRYAHQAGLIVSITPSATPKVTFERIAALKEAGLAHWAFSLDGSTPEIHDHFRGIHGCFDLTMEKIGYLHQLDIPLQINTTVSRFNVTDLTAIAEKVSVVGAVRWSLFFLIPTGRAKLSDMLSPQEQEEVLQWLYTLRGKVPFDIKTTEGPQIRRIAALQEGRITPAEAALRKELRGVSRSEKPIWDGNGFLFVSHVGEVFPSGFLPVKVGNVREQPLSEIYRNAPELVALRTPTHYHGKCGWCPYNTLCGGSRARAYGVTGDFLESDPFCTYIPDPRMLSSANRPYAEVVNSPSNQV